MIEQDRLAAALALAHEAHRTQKRKGTDIPYIAHPMAVASLVLEYGGSEDQAIAALLHDTIEDTEATRAEIDQIFGPEIGALVEGLTKLKRLELVSREAKQAETSSEGDSAGIARRCCMYSSLRSRQLAYFACGVRAAALCSKLPSVQSRTIASTSAPNASLIRSA